MYYSGLCTFSVAVVTVTVTKCKLSTDQTLEFDIKFTWIFQSFKSNSSSLLSLLKYLWLVWVKSIVIMVLGSDEDLAIAVCSLPFE